jgi:hypothetical protein
LEELMETTYNMTESCFQTISISYLGSSYKNIENALEHYLIIQKKQLLHRK